MAQANQYGFDLGNVLAQAEDIGAARIRNTLSSQALADQNAIRAERGNVLNKGSNPAALAVIDPGAANELMTFIGNLDQTQRDNLSRETEEIGKAAAFILQAPEAQREELYQEVRGKIPEKLRSQMPEVYDESWVKFNLAQAQSIDQILKQDTGKGPTAQTGIGKIAADAAAGFIDEDTANKLISAEMKKTLDEGGAAASLETGIINAIRSTVTSQFGGTYSPVTGEFAGLDPQTAPQALAVMALAEKLVMSEKLQPAQAVQKAIAQVQGGAGGPTPALGGAAPAVGANNDPLGIR